MSYFTILDLILILMIKSSHGSAYHKNSWRVQHDQHMPTHHLVLDRWTAYSLNRDTIPLSDRRFVLWFFFIILTSLRMCPQWHHQASRCTGTHANRKYERSVQCPHSQELLRNKHKYRVPTLPVQWIYTTAPWLLIYKHIRWNFNLFQNRGNHVNVLLSCFWMGNPKQLVDW